jgi:hypothetical protein
MNKEEYDYFIMNEQMFGQAFVLDQRIRSRVIYNSILLENAVQKIITTHFCRERGEEILFSSLMFREGQITFSKKITILGKLLKLAYPDLYKQCKWAIAQIDKVREIRNDFAHSETTVLIDDAVKQAQGEPIEGVTLESWKDGQVVYKVVSSKEALGYMDRALALTILLGHLQSEIETRISTQKAGGFNLERTIRLVNKVYRYASLKMPSSS